MAAARKIDRFKRRLGYQFCFHNCSNKIWILWSNDYVLDIIEDREQHVLVHISDFQRPISFFVTVVYTKCDEQLRNILWDDLIETTSSISGPWGVVGDFNVISSTEEKIGGREFKVEESLDFISCLSDCELQDGGYVGTAFIWSNNRDTPNMI